ncbi:MAG: serine/threonine protein kinase [Myxococcales bacterium]|nr:serine/threonine protein kinase [Myxococcales bacterium]
MSKSSSQVTSAWTERVDDEETRAYFQQRLLLFAKMMFIIDTLFFGIALLAYQLYPSMMPSRINVLHLIGGICLLLLFAAWHLLLPREHRSLRQLLALDAFLIVSMAVAFGILCFFSYDRTVNMWSVFIWTIFLVFGRVLYVPSTAARTAVLSAIAFTCIAAAGTAVAVWRPEGLSVPGPVWAFGSIFYGAVAVLIAAVGSHVMYGLRSRVLAAEKLGQYTLGRKIGEGGMGAVYEAHHALLRRPTAIKLLPPQKAGAESMVRFEREVQITAELNHPNTVEIYDYGRSRDGLFYYAMEFLDGMDLETLVAEHGPQTPARVVHILAQASGALQEAHARELIHRDIKPANILLCELGGVPDIAKVVDFGLVKELKDDSMLTTGSMVGGTPAYISPEAVMDPDSVGPVSDLYALGAVGYFLLTGTPLFRATSLMEMCVHHVRSDPDPVAERTEQEISSELASLIMECLSKEVSERPESATEFRSRLRAVPESELWDEDAALEWWRSLPEKKPPSEAIDCTAMTIQRAALGAADTVYPGEP